MPFTDNQARLFGREAAILSLTERARQTGLTAVVARPLMGKTWTLTEVGRRLSESGDFLVGYHESKASESSHLLYAVSNLYTAWLSDSTLRQQALSLWQRHKAGLVPQAGRMVGALFEKLGAGVTGHDGVGGLVRSSFEGLAEAQKDLLTGGIQIAPLPYDQARSLTDLVARVSRRRVVLILDAWEKSPSIRAEHSTLEAFLKHPDEWPATHVFLAIRDPDLIAGDASNEAFNLANRLNLLSAQAVIHQLAPLDLSAAAERARLLDHIRQQVPAAGAPSDDSLIHMIDGFPGVVGRWLSEANRLSMQTDNDLKREAADAQTLRYHEFNELLPKLGAEGRTLAARLAFFPRLDAERWQTFRPILLDGLNESVIDDLVQCHVLEDALFPTFGHDTRHAAARRWYCDQQKGLISRQAEALVASLAANVTELSTASLPFAGALAGCAVAISQVPISPHSRCLIQAAQLLIEGEAAITDQDFDRALTAAARQNESALPLAAMALSKRGFYKLQNDDGAGAIADFTAVIELPGAPVAQAARAFFSRGVAKGKSGDTAGEVADYTAVIELPGAPTDHVAKALVNRGVTKGDNGDRAGALVDFTATIELPGSPADQVAKALVKRAFFRQENRDHVSAMADYTRAIELPDAPVEELAMALYNRGVAKRRGGDHAGALADCTLASELPGVSTDMMERIKQMLEALHLL